MVCWFNCYDRKNPGSIETEKLRAILLMESDFNFSNRLYFRKRLTKESEKGNFILDEQFSSRKEHSAKEVAL